MNPCFYSALSTITEEKQGQEDMNPCYSATLENKQNIEEPNIHVTRQH